MLRVLVVGEVCEDIILHNPKSIPVLGENIWSEDITVTMGGSASYVATALAHLGLHVELWSTFGDDVTGSHLVQQISGYGVDCNFVKKIQGMDTTRCMVVCDSFRKKFIGCSPMLPMILPPEIRLDHTDIVYMAGYLLYPELWREETFFFFLRKARIMGIPVMLDGQFLPISSNPIKMARLSEVLPLTHTFFAAQKEARQLTGSILPDVAGKELLDMGVEYVVLKQGAEGCVVMSKDVTLKIPGHPVHAYDSVGAGDLFGAAYSYGLVNRWSIRTCAEFATVFSALSLEKYKGFKKYPSIEEVSKTIEKNKEME
ncbi:hypothetical protein CVT91_10115 [Candidatus Atribacteria bacterium HGW-Atribacteria-1]|nr:MAG: hypothetical protein CVT91_10115 [Candidatus Atribacteria bacterium HGW-Atribacteria-1]